MKKPTTSKKIEQKWLLTYSDMVTLLLIFFIALVAISDIKTVKTRVILSTFSGNIGLLRGGKTLEEVDNFVNYGRSIESLPAKKSESNLEKKDKEFSALFSPLVENKKIRFVENQEGVIISLFSDVFFEDNSAKVNYSAMREILKNINLLLSGKNFLGNILVEGHTDNTAYQGREFSDNWELSMARALSVVNAIRSFPFVQKIDEERLSMHAYGSTRPIGDNQDPIERAYNRRVDIVLKRK